MVAVVLAYPTDLVKSIRTASTNYFN